MSVDFIFYCDAEGCERHMQTTRERPDDHWTFLDGNGFHMTFCSFDCCMKWCASQPPMEIIPWNPSEEETP